MPPVNGEKPFCFQNFLNAVREFFQDSHSDNWDMQVNFQDPSSDDDGPFQLEKTESSAKKNHQPSPLAHKPSNDTTKPSAELRKPPAGTSRADSYNILKSDRDSEDYYSSDEEHGGAVLDSIQQVTDRRGAFAKSPVKSEAEIVEDIVHQLPQLSRSGKERVLSTLFHEPNSNNAESLAWAVFRDLHSWFPGCISKNKSEAAMKELYQEKNELLAEYGSMHSLLREKNAALQKEELRADAYRKRAENGLKTVKKLQKKVEDLSNLHVRSMNEIGAGLEPITDQSFSTMLENHHKNSFHWCRKNVGVGGRQLGDTYDQLSEPLKAYFDAQCHESVVRYLPLSRAADLVLWKALHDLALKPWFPVNIPKYADYSWEGVQASFSKPDDPEHQQRIEFWRGYTACLAFKSLDFQAAIDAEVENLVSEFLPIVTQLLQPAPPKVNIQTLRNIIRAVYITAAEMKCQQGHYEIEQIPVGAEFDEDSMENAEKTSDLDGQTTHYVHVVLSEGIVKRPYRGSLEQVGRVWATQVFVGEKTEEIVADHRVDQGEGTVVDAEDVVMG